MRFRQDDIVRGEEESAPLHICRACSEPFVVPVSIVDIVDADRYVVELWCANCDRSSLSAHYDAELEVLDRQLVTSTAQIRAALEVIETVDQIVQAERFAAALRDDHILPEDF